MSVLRAAFAVLQDVAPMALGLSWIVLVAAVLTGNVVLAMVAGIGCLIHVRLIVRPILRNRTPRWVAEAPRLAVGVANVYVDNDDPEVAARQLLAMDVEVLCVVETTPEFRAVFDAAGGTERYPFRVFDVDDRSEYASSLYLREEPIESSMQDIGELRAATALVAVGEQQLRIVGAIPVAVVEAGGYDIWERQISSLADFAEHHLEPLVIVGDLNTTTHRRAFRRLVRAGLRDAHGILGAGLRPSFQLMADGALAALGPLVRLDHALVNQRVWPLHVEDLDPAGSDHRPFAVSLAVRADSAPGGR